jgi:hypothetical protein
MIPNFSGPNLIGANKFPSFAPTMFFFNYFCFWHRFTRRHDILLHLRILQARRHAELVLSHSSWAIPDDIIKATHCGVSGISLLQTPGYPIHRHIHIHIYTYQLLRGRLCHVPAQRDLYAQYVLLFSHTRLPVFET